MVFKKSLNPVTIPYNARLTKGMNEAVTSYIRGVYQETNIQLTRSDIVREALLMFLKSKGILGGK